MIFRRASTETPSTASTAASTIRPVWELAGTMALTIGVGVLVGVAVGVADGVTVGVAVAVSVGVGVGVFRGTYSQLEVQVATPPCPQSQGIIDPRQLKARQKSAQFNGVKHAREQKVRVDWQSRQTQQPDWPQELDGVAATATITVATQTSSNFATG